MREVRLYGKLGATFGRVHRFDVQSPAEAMRALRANFPSIERYMLESDKAGVGYAVFADKENVKADELDHPVGKATIRIAPILRGAKNGGLFEIILGTVLFAAGALTGNVFLMKMGGALVLGGIVNQLSPHPAAPNPSQSTPSYIFGGVINTTEVGMPVPIGYGRLRVGSAVISSGIYTNDIPLDYKPQTIPKQS